MEKLNIPIEIGDHDCKIVHVWGQVATPAELTDDNLTVYFEFINPPEGILGLSITIPAKEYSKDELFAIIKSEGEKQVAEAIARQKKEQEEYALRQQKGERIGALAKKAAELLKKGG